MEPEQFDKMMEKLEEIRCVVIDVETAVEKRLEAKKPGGNKMEQDISSAVQSEISRIREMITTTKELLPNVRINFGFFYEMILAEAERAVREQDAVALVKILPELRDMQ